MLATLLLAAAPQQAPPEQLFRLPVTPRQGRLIAAPDLDGDGLQDFSWATAGAVTTYSSATLTQLAQIQSPLIEYASTGKTVAWIGDANGDGHPDLIRTSVLTLYFPLTIIDGITGAEIRVVSSSNVGVGFSAFGSFPDVDGDGETDFYMLTRPNNGSPDKVLELRSGATGGLVRSFIRPDNQLFGSSLGVYPVDLDGDGLFEVLASDIQSGSPGRGLLISSATGAELVEYPAPTLGGPIRQNVQALGDLDRDGAPDVLAWEERPSEDDRALLFSGATGALLYALEGGGATGSQDSVLGEAGVDLGDLDGDGHDDFAIADSTSSRVAVFSGATGRELLQLTGAPDRGFGTGLLAPGDLDGDGFGDLICGYTFDPEASQSTFVIYGYRFIERDTIIEFEAEPTGGAPIANGKALDQEAPLTQPYRVVSGPFGAFEVAAFDSSPTGPNAGGPGSRLLVDAGHIAFVQGDPAQTVPGIFDVPAPDPAGGELTFRFRGRCEPISIDLFDVDPTTTVQIVLHDDLGGTRTLNVPGGFTAEAQTDVERTRWTLALDTLAPQQGFSASATGFEDPGYRKNRVTSIDVLTTGPSAIGRLRVAGLQAVGGGTLGSVAPPAGGQGVVAALGLEDVSGDGRDDLLLIRTAGTSRDIEVYGSATSPSSLYTIPGVQGGAPEQLGDIDGDGVRDLALGWDAWSDAGGTARGEVRFFSGASGAQIDRLEGAGPGARFGATLCVVGDPNADGTADFAVGAPGVQGGAGEISIHSGADRSLLFSISGAMGEALGERLTAVDDIDGDGVQDLATSVQDPGALTGGARVYSGATGALLMNRSLGPTCAPVDGLFAVSDADGDGLRDLFLHVDEPGCSSLVISSVTGLTLETLPPHPYATSALVPGDLDGDRRDDVVFVEERTPFVIGVRGHSIAASLELFTESRLVPSGGGLELAATGDLVRSGRQGFALLGDLGTTDLGLFELDADLWTVCSGASYGGGDGARLRTVGSPSVSTNALALEAWNLPSTGFVLLMNASATIPGAGPGSVPLLSDGTLCLAPQSLARFSTVFPVTGRESLMPIDLTALPTSGAPGFSAAAQAGETRFFQAWFRDPGGFFGSNLSDAVGVRFTN